MDLGQSPVISRIRLLYGVTFLPFSNLRLQLKYVNTSVRGLRCLLHLADPLETALCPGVCMSQTHCSAEAACKPCLLHPGCTTITRLLACCQRSCDRCGRAHPATGLAALFVQGTRTGSACGASCSTTMRQVRSQTHDVLQAGRRCKPAILVTAHCSVPLCKPVLHLWHDELACLHTHMCQGISRQCG